MLILCSPHYKAEPSEFDERRGFSITKGKCWTLKMSKDDETTPGPVYDTQYLQSVMRKVDTTDELKNGSFGAYRDRQRTIPNKGFEKAFVAKDSPGPVVYGSMH